MNLPNTIVGVRHEHHAPRECLCGCQWTDGLEGRVLFNGDTPKLLTLDPPMLVAEFSVPCPAGGKPRTVGVAYTVAETVAA